MFIYSIAQEKLTLHPAVTWIALPLLFTAVIFMLSGDVLAKGNSSARAVALGSAYTSLATGIDAARFNPANLGLESHQQNGIELVGVGANVNNNSFTLDDYNKYTGAYLTDGDKDYILSKIPNEGFKLSMDAEAAAVGLSIGSFAFSSNGAAIADINMSKDLMNLILNGNTFADTIDITGSYSAGYAYASFGVSYGTLLYSQGSRQLSVGATYNYLKGFGYEEVVSLQGMAATFATGFEGNGEAIIRTASGGSGYAIDLGSSLQLTKNYTVGAVIKNFVSGITWTDETEEHGYLFDFDTMTVDNMGEDYVTSEDYTKEIPSFKSSLPSSLQIGFAKTAGNFLWAVDWEQGFSSKTGVSTEPRISAGAEWYALGFLPIRAGYATGGKENSSFSFGSGLHFAFFYLDAAVVTGSSFSGSSSKGANFALTTGLVF
ncbi:MAG: hypothetical protein DWP97_08010 [Calditrichaeota bacterium]|nr:MAG: hypothetical protein DWP97_08010 [Calditrichota bacterium]